MAGVRDYAHEVKRNMKKYVLLGILALALLAIPLAVAAESVPVQVQGTASCWFGLTVTPPTLTFDDFSIGGPHHTATVTVSEQANCPWKIDLSAVGQGPSGPINGDMCLSDQSYCLNAWFYGYTQATSGYVNLKNPSNYQTGSANVGWASSNMDFTQVVTGTDLGGVYSIVATFTIGPQ